MQSNLCVIQHRANALKSDRILQSRTPEQMLVGISEPQLRSLIEFARNVRLRHEANGRLERVRGWLCERPRIGGEIANFQVLTGGSIDGEYLYNFLNKRF